MRGTDPVPSLLVQQTDIDSLIESVTESIVDRLTPLLEQSDGPRLVGRDEMAVRLNVSTGKVDDLVRAEQIPSVQIGSRRLFEPQAVIAALSASDQSTTFLNVPDESP